MTTNFIRYNIYQFSHKRIECIRIENKRYNTRDGQYLNFYKLIKTPVPPENQFSSSFSHIWSF
jgi:hypothetical protein